jgi:nucleoside-diphosphate-sugar epimerase
VALEGSRRRWLCGIWVSRRVLVTGAMGFVGRILCETLTRRGMQVRAATRRPFPPSMNVAETCVVGEIGSSTAWDEALADVDWVIHLAAHAHILRGNAADAAYDEVNARGTQRLAEVAARSGVVRLVYLSTVKVNGERTSGGAYTAHEEPRPVGAYALSKWNGELALRKAALRSQLQQVIVRSPLVYGAGVRANFLNLMDWIRRGRPLPFGAVRNLRSLISVWNLADVLVRAAEHPLAGGRVWMVSDGTDVSTPQLLRALGLAMGRSVKLMPMPVSLLRLAGTLAGRRAEVDRLCGSLVVDISETRSTLDWTPPLTLQAGLERTATWYLAENRSDAS